MSAISTRTLGTETDADLDGLFASVAGLRTDRRSLLRRATGLGLALPALGAMVAGPGRPAVAQDQSAETAPVQPFVVYDPYLTPVQAGTKDITVTAKDATLYVAKDVAMSAWTFDGTIPGRMLRVVEGDTINFTLAIDPSARVGHSLDFHSAKTPPDVNYRTINPGETLSFGFTPKYPGAFMYHCGTPPVLMHIGAGMYGAMIVDPKGGWKPAQELAIVQSEIFLKDAESGIFQPDYTKMVGNGNMDYCVFNGYANQYVENPIQVETRAPIRMFVVNAGPDAWSSFHVVGTVFDAVYVNGNPSNKLVGLQSISIGPGDGAVVEFTLDEPGSYPFVNHAFGHAAQGAVGLLQAS
jgi:nitrite reductase (NO-forming)